MAMRVVQEFTVSYNRIIEPDGTLSGALPKFAESKTEMIAMLRAMWRTRRFDNRTVALQRTGFMGTYATCLGQEAVGVGVAAAMRPDDVLLPFYRDSAAQLFRGVSPLELLLYWAGVERGSNFVKAKHDFPICVTIGAQTLHAVGVAYAMQVMRQKGVAVSMSGDGSTSKGDFYEAINCAGVWKVPAIFVINNNQWAISVPRSKQSATPTLAQKAIAAGFPGVQVDGNDVVAVRAAAEEAFERARCGEGPTLIEAVTYRLSDHTTADDASRYREAEEVQKAWQEEPIRRLTAYLIARNWWSKEEEKALLETLDREIEEGVAAYRATEPQPPQSMFDYLYATLPQPMAEQRAQCLAEAAEKRADG